MNKMILCIERTRDRLSKFESMSSISLKTSGDMSE